MGKKGKVLASTYIEVSSPEFLSSLPYSYAVVDFGNFKKELMGVGNEKLEAGDEVECVFRKISTPSHSSLIEYGIKAKKI